MKDLDGYDAAAPLPQALIGLADDTYIHLPLDAIGVEAVEFGSEGPVIPEGEVDSSIV